MKRLGWVALLLVGATLAYDGAAQPDQKLSEELVEKQALLEREKQQFFAQANAIQTGTVEKFSVGKVYLQPYNPASDVTTLLVPQITPIYQGNEKVTLDAIVPGTSVRIHFRFSPSPNQPARAIAIEILGINEARAAKMQAIQSPPVLNEGRGQIPAIPPPEKAEVLADASGSMQGHIVRLEGSSISFAPEGQQPRRIPIDPFVSVFDGPFRVGTGFLQPGRDVRVYLKQSGKNAPLIIAVDLLKQKDDGAGASK